jgi:hypothetical protein
MGVVKERAADPLSQIRRAKGGGLGTWGSHQAVFFVSISDTATMILLTPLPTVNAPRI